MPALTVISGRSRLYRLSLYRSLGARGTETASFRRRTRHSAGLRTTAGHDAARCRRGVHARREAAALERFWSGQTYGRRHGLGAASTLLLAAWRRWLRHQACPTSWPRSLRSLAGWRASGWEGLGRRRKVQVRRLLLGGVAGAMLAIAAFAWAVGSAAAVASTLEPGSLARAQTIRTELDARYRVVRGRGIAVTEAT